jgi:hypothetical protein
VHGRELRVIHWVHRDWRLVDGRGVTELRTGILKRLSDGLASCLVMRDHDLVKGELRLHPLTGVREIGNLRFPLGDIIIEPFVGAAKQGKGE